MCQLSENPGSLNLLELSGAYLGLYRDKSTFVFYSMYNPLVLLLRNAV
jgi:hypothetical protein